MKKRFNITGVCVPSKHYMVDISRQLEQIRDLVDDGAYFTINKARQYGKTTTLNALAKDLASEYLVVSMDFQALGNESFANEKVFSLTFAQYFLQRMQLQSPEIQEKLSSGLDDLKRALKEEKDDFSLYYLFRHFVSICGQSPKPLVLMIDEVDSASDNQVFLDFLAQLRNYYLERDTLGTKTFHSVILAGVYDIKNLKRKIRSEESHSVNSPWNIAATFNIDMSFSKSDIAGMLKDYAEDRHINMNVSEIAGLIYDYTSGYPFLVSRLCKLMDETVSQTDCLGSADAAWTNQGFFEAERILLSEKNTLFESLIGKLQSYPELNTALMKILFTGINIPYNTDEPAFDIASMFGFIKNNRGCVAIANRIFETRLYNLYLSRTQLQNTDTFSSSQRDRNQFVIDGHLNMRRILEKFVVHFHDLYGNGGETFIENDGRKYFLLYLRPIINGTGNYYVEAQTRNLSRTDVIVDYQGEQFIIELKIWRGDEYHRRGERQLIEYLDSYHVQKGYMLSFNFNKKKEIGVHEIILGDKTLIEAVV